MRADQRAAIWDEVWAEYDARQMVRALAAPPPPAREPPASAGAAGRRPWEAERARWPKPRLAVHLVMGLLAGAVLLGCWLVLPWLLAVRLSVPIGQGDAPALLRQIDAPSTLASLRAGLVAEVPENESAGARRYLSAMADRMAESWARPEGMAAWLRMRGRGGREDGPAVALFTLRSARAVGLASFRLEYGPGHEGGRVAFDMAWQGDGFRVTGVRFLDARPAPAGAAGPVVAMR